VYISALHNMSCAGSFMHIGIFQFFFRNTESLSVRLSPGISLRKWREGGRRALVASLGVVGYGCRKKGGVRAPFLYSLSTLDTLIVFPRNTW
jgi:hypothetical protein